MKVDLKERKIQLIVGGVVIGLGILIYYLFKNKPLGVEVMQINTNGIKPNETHPKIQSNLNFDLVLKQGDEGDEVKELQRILIENFGQDLGDYGVNKDGIDGKFGTATLAGLLKAKQVSKIALKDF
jgi:hypothetical protein